MKTLFSFKHTPRQADFDAFARISGDDNPIHVDEHFAARTRFGRTVAHGMMLFAILRGAVAKASPGVRLGEVFLMFPNPAFTGETLVFQAQLEEAGASAVVHAEARRASGGEIVCEARMHMVTP